MSEPSGWAANSAPKHKPVFLGTSARNLGKLFWFPPRRFPVSILCQLLLCLGPF